MAQNNIDLGSLDLYSATSGLQLRLSSQAVFASYDTDINLLNRPTVDAIESDVRERPYIFCDNGFRMIFCLNFEDSLNEDVTVQIQALSHQLKDAEVSTVSVHTSRQTSLTLFTVMEPAKHVSDFSRDFHPQHHRT